MPFLVFQSGIPVNSLILIRVDFGLNFLCFLGLRQSMIEHFLVITDQPHLPSESLIPVVLRLTENIILFLDRGSMGLTPFRIIIQLLVLSKTIVESPLIPSWLVHRFHATCIIRNITISTSAIISVSHRFRVDLGQLVGGRLLCYHERPYLEMNFK